MTSETTARTVLLVTGVACSGTTELSRLLGSHSRICLGHERYKHLFLRNRRPDAGLFTRERFFDIRPGDTNQNPARRPALQDHYATLRRKWPDARIVGDSIPGATHVLGQFLEDTPDARSVFLLRNLKDVALCWQDRADRARGGWPPEHDFETACTVWAEQMRLLQEVLRDKTLRRRVLLLDHDTLHASPVHTEAALLAFLGLSEEAAFTRALAEQAALQARRRARKVPEIFAPEYKAVDQKPARSLRNIAREQLSFWAEQYQ